MTGLSKYRNFAFPSGWPLRSASSTIATQAGAQFPSASTGCKSRSAVAGCIDRLVVSETADVELLELAACEYDLFTVGCAPIPVGCMLLPPTERTVLSSMVGKAASSVRKMRPSVPPPQLARYEDNPGARQGPLSSEKVMGSRTHLHCSSGTCGSVVGEGAAGEWLDNKGVAPLAARNSLSTNLTSSDRARSIGNWPRLFCFDAQLGHSDIKERTTSACPPRAATCNGVLPWRSRKRSTTLELLNVGPKLCSPSTNAWTTAGLPFQAAMCRADQRSRMGFQSIFHSSRLSSKTCRSTRAPSSTSRRQISAAAAPSPPALQVSTASIRGVLPSMSNLFRSTTTRASMVILITAPMSARSQAVNMSLTLPEFFLKVLMYQDRNE
mmetsp:Transcript_43326/g.77800  ORF Transcript_43326/g.77800 Transcript_43326/m.77800 type:complete len:382 (+) Transcript_43326:1153-2298(+)